MRKPPKLDRKALKKPDEFVVRGNQIMIAARGHQGIWISALVILAVLGIGFYGFNLWSAAHTEKAWKAYLDAQKLPEDKKWDGLKSFYSDYRSSRPTFFAALALADHYYKDAKKEAEKEKGDPSKPASDATNWYTKALTYGALLPTEKQLLLIDRGNSQEVAKKVDEALNDFQAASDLEGQVKPLAMLGIARIQESKKQTDKAIETYTKISSQFADTEYGKLAKNYLHRLKSPLFKDDPNL